MGNKVEVKVTIRRMRRKDTDLVLDCNRNLKGPRETLSACDMVEINPGGPLDLSFIAETEEKIIGFIIARLVYSYLPTREVCLISGLVVDPVYRRQYIGSKLVNELLNYCKEQEIQTVRGLVHERNEELKRVVENLGFHRSLVVNFDKNFES